MAYSFIHSVSCYRSESTEILNLLRVLSFCGSLRDNTRVYVLSHLHSLRFAFTHSPQMSELTFPLHKHSKQVVHIHCIKMFWFVLVRSLRNKHATIQTCPVPFHLGYHCLSLIWSLYYYTELHDVSLSKPFLHVSECQYSWRRKGRQSTALKDYFQETFGLPDMQHDWNPII